MAFPDHAQLLFYSSYTGTLLCTIYRNYGISRSTLVFLLILICDHNYSETLLCTIGRIV